MTVDNNGFYVERVDPVITTCATIYEYKITSVNGNIINITLTGDEVNSYIVTDTMTFVFQDKISGVEYNDSMSLYFILENSESSGIFYDVNLQINDSTLSDTYSITETREDDTIKCPIDILLIGLEGLTSDSNIITADNNLITANNG